MDVAYLNGGEETRGNVYMGLISSGFTTQVGIFGCGREACCVEVSWRGGGRQLNEVINQESC